MSPRHLQGAEREQALRRTVVEWGEIYCETIERAIAKIERDNSAVDGKPLWHAYARDTKPAIKRIAKRFQHYGLSLDVRLTYTGVVVMNMQAGQVFWDNPKDPEIIFQWPDNTKLAFKGLDAQKALGFFEFYKQAQVPILGPSDMEPGARRILSAGDADHDHYMAAKKADQDAGRQA